MPVNRRTPADDNTPAAEIPATAAAPVLDDAAAAAQQRALSQQLRQQAAEVMQAAAEARRAAEQGDRDASKTAQALQVRATEHEREAARFERRVSLASQLDALAKRIGETERELAYVLAETSKITAELDQTNARLAELSDLSESAQSELTSAIGAGDHEAVARLRLRVRAVEEVQAETAASRNALTERAESLANDGGTRVHTERLIKGLRERRDAILKELHPEMIAQRAAVQTRIAGMANADTEEQIRAVTALLAGEAAPR